jgi:hypothetical protein
LLSCFVAADVVFPAVPLVDVVAVVDVVDVVVVACFYFNNF